jgi:hypothetical protein
MEMKKWYKSWVSILLALAVFLTLPAMALACNWGVEVKGDCNTLTLKINIARGNQEVEGTYDLYWAKAGNAKAGEIIASGTIPALKAGETHQITYSLDQNPNGKEGVYIFHLKEPRGSIWSEQVEVKGCKKEETPSVKIVNQGGDCKGIWAEVKNGSGSLPLNDLRYEIYHAASGDAKTGTKVGEGTLPPLEPGTVGKIVFDLKNMTAPEGNYAVKVATPNGKVLEWSQTITVSGPCQKPASPSNPPAVSTPSAGVGTGSQSPGQSQSPQTGGNLPKTASSYPMIAETGLVLFLSGLTLLLSCRLVIKNR